MNIHDSHLVHLYASSSPWGLSFPWLVPWTWLPWVPDVVAVAPNSGEEQKIVLNKTLIMYQGNGFNIR